MPSALPTRPTPADRGPSFTPAVGTLATASFATASLATVGALGEHVYHRPPGSLDLDVAAWALAHRAPGALVAFAWISRVGAPIYTAALAVGVAVWLWRTGARHAARVLVAAPVLAVMLFNLVKYGVRRARPAGGLSLRVLTFSFPSGHSAVAAAVFCTLAWVLAREGRLPWFAALALGLLCPLLIGASRVYLDVHWTTDVLAGWALGVAVAALAIGAYEVRSAHRRPTV